MARMIGQAIDTCTQHGRRRCDCADLVVLKARRQDRRTAKRRERAEWRREVMAA